jgi:hypothetical protein
MIIQTGKYTDSIKYYHTATYTNAYEYSINLAKQKMGVIFEKVYQNGDDNFDRFVNSENRSKKYEIVWKYQDNYHWLCKIVSTNSINILDVYDNVHGRDISTHTQLRGLIIYEVFPNTIHIDVLSARYIERHDNMYDGNDGSIINIHTLINNFRDWINSQLKEMLKVTDIYVDITYKPPNLYKAPKKHLLSRLLCFNTANTI